MPAIQHEFLGTQSARASVFVQGDGVIHELAPTVRGMNVDFDHTRIRCDFNDAQSWIIRRRISFDEDRHLEPGRSLFERSDEFKVVLGGTDWRKKDPKPPVSSLH